MPRTVSTAAFCVTALMGALFLAPSPARAQYRISGGLGYLSNPTGARDSYFAIGAVPFGDGVQIEGTQHLDTARDIAFLAQTSSFAGAGYLASASNGRYQQNFRDGPGSTVTYGGSNFAEFTLTDVIISGTPGRITTSLNLHLSGTQITGAINEPAIGETSSNGHASVQLQAVVNGNNQIGQGAKTYGTTWRSDGVELATGWLTNWSGDGDLTSDPFTVNANEYFTLMVQLQTSAYATAWTAQFGGASGSADFSHTASFATDQPVFNLPAGYTASSASAGMVDNTFSVPESGALLTLSAWGTGLVLSARRRHRRA